MYPHAHVIWRSVGTFAYPLRVTDDKFIPANDATVEQFAPRAALSVRAFYFTAPIPDNEPVDIIHMDRFFEIFEDL